jgi:LPS-assembly lipoprotein
MLWRNFLLILPTIALILTSGCGFKPLFSETQSTSRALETVKVAIIKDRIGQQLRNRLLDLINPAGQPLDPHYRLEVILDETERELSFRKDLVARRKSMSLNATFQLREMKTNKVIYQKVVEAHNSFSLGASSDFAAFSSYALEQDSRTRMIEVLAHDIKLQVSNFLLHHTNERKKLNENNPS